MQKTLFLFLLVLLFGQNLLAEVDQWAVLTGTETTSTGDPTDLNQSSAFALKWSSSDIDTDYFDHSTSVFSNQIRITASGDYRLYFTLPITLQDTSSNRRSLIAEVYVNGSPVESGRFSGGYIRQASGHAESSIHGTTLLTGLSVNDKIEIFVIGDTYTGRVTTVGAQLAIEYVDPAKKIFFATTDRTTNSTNLNQGTEYALEWTEEVEDSIYTHSDSSSPENITITEAGDYWVLFNLPIEKTCGSIRNNLLARVKINGSTVTGGSAAQGYIRCLDNHHSAQIQWAGLVQGVLANDILTVTVRNETNNTESLIVPSSRKGSLQIEQVGTTDRITLSGTDLLSGTNWNTSVGSEILWNTTISKDATAFTHSTSTDSKNITVNADGNYLVFFNSHLTSTVQRANPLIKIKVNNSAQTGATCKSHYIRAQEGHNDASCSLTYFLESLSNGDIISIESIAEAATGTVNDASPATITIYKVNDTAPPPPGSIIDEVPDKVLHVDAQDLSTILDSSNRVASDLSFTGSIQTWKDKSGSSNIHNLTQTTASRQATFDDVNKFVVFDGADDYFTVANHTDLNIAPQLKERTIVAAFKTGSDVTNPQVIYEEGGTIRGMNVFIRAGNIYIGFWNDREDGDGTQPFVSASTPVLPNTHYYTSLVLDYSNYTGGAGPDGQLRGHINGVEFLTLGTTTSLLYAHSGGIGIGAKNGDTHYDNGPTSGTGDNNFEGEIFELIIYNHAIDNTEALEFYDYLTDRWPDPQPPTNLALSNTYTTDNTTTPNFTWTSSISPDVNDYQAALGTTEGGTEVVSWTSLGDVTTGNLSGLSLAECTNYYVSLKALDADLNESTSETTAFLRYDGTVPTDPSALVISGGSSTTNSKTLSWTSSTDTCSFSHYEAAIGTTPGATNITGWVDIGNVASHAFSGLSLSDSTDYYTSIRAYDSAGNVSSIVTSASWQVDGCVVSDSTAPTDPTSFAFTGVASSTTSPDHSWGASTDTCGFSHYEVSVGTSATATNVIGWTNVGDVLTHKFFNISPTLNTLTDYYTNVRAVDLAGNPSNVVSTSSWQLPTPGNVSSGLVMWLDAQDTGTLFTDTGCSSAASDGNTIGCWRDKSASANNLTATGGASPTWRDNQFNSSAIVRFDGSNDALDFSSEISTIRTIFVVNKSDTANHQLLLGHTTSQHFYTSSGVLIHPTISDANLRTGNWRVDQADVSSPTIFNQTGSYSLISVVTSGNVSADHISSDRKQSGRFFDGDVAEVIVYNRPLDSTEISAVETYLFEKWFSAAPAVVTELALTNDYSSSSASSPQFTWTHSTSPDVSYYEVALGTFAGANDVAGWINVGLVSNYQFLGLSLGECTDYFVSVRAVDGDGFVSSAQSAGPMRYDGTNPAAASGLVLSGTAAETVSQTLTWNSASDSCSFSHYEVALGTTPNGDEVVDWTNIGDTNSHQFTGISPDLVQATDYFISVRSVDSAGNQSSSVSSSSFQLETCLSSDVTAPTTPSGLSTSGTASLTQSPTLLWSASSDTCSFSGYEIGIGTSSGATNIVAFTDIGDVLTTQVAGISPYLSYGTDYYLTLRSRDHAGNYSPAVSSSSWQLASPGGVDPTGLSLWYDADDLSTLYSDNSCTTSIVANDTAIGCVRDKSGNDIHATQATSFNQPTYKDSNFNGKRAIYFDGATDEFLSFTAQSDIRTVFWVVKEDASNPGNTAFLLGHPEGTTYDFHRDSTLGPIFDSGLASASVRSGTLKLNGSAINGTTTAMPTSESLLSLVTTGNVTASALSKDRDSCCSNRTWGGSFSEVIVYNRALSTTEVENIEAALMLKWGINSADTDWEGTVDTDWYNSSNWSNGVPNSAKNCTINDKTNDPDISGSTATCRSITIGTGSLSMSSGASLEIYGDFINNGTFTQAVGTTLVIRDNGSDGTNQFISSGTAIESVSFNKTAGGAFNFANTTNTVNSFNVPTGNNFAMTIPSGRTLILPNGATQSSATIVVGQGGTLQIGAGQTYNLSGGLFRTTGTNDAYPQNLTNKATITRQGASGAWGFHATGGTVLLSGFLIEYLDANGLRIFGNANLQGLDGGQFVNLASDFVTPVRAIHLNTTASLSESLAQNVGFNWSTANGTHSGSPGIADNYYTVYAENCNNSAVVFDQWYGDFYPGLGLDTESKIYDADDGSATCQISMDISASPVNLITFAAQSFDQKVELNWTTSAETQHQGFNVYRSEQLYANYVQLNSDLIRNFNNSTTFRGDYRFVDQALTNGQVYYYMIEDIANDGSSQLHGPVSAIPLAINGNPVDPPTEDEVNEVTNPSAPSIDLGDGAEVISQIQGTFRLRVTPDSLQVSDKSGYKSLFVPGYTRTTQSGYPELLERKILVEVEEGFSSVQVTEIENISSDSSASLVSTHVIPAASWAPDGSGVLQPSYGENSSAYGSGDFSPLSFYSVRSAPVELQGKVYVEITVFPVRYRASDKTLTKLDQLVIDIGLDSQAWSTETIGSDTTVSPAAVSGGVRLRYSNSGMMQVSFQDLKDNHTEGVLANLPITQIRGYYHGQEIPLEINSTDSTFNSGDTIRFFADHSPSLDDPFDEVVLTRHDFSGDDALRINSWNNQPSLYPIAAPGYRMAQLILEENNMSLFDAPLGTLVDRFYWHRIFTVGGSATNGSSRFDHNFTLPDYEVNSSNFVNVKVYLRGRPVLALNPTHSIALYINNTSTPNEFATFTSKDPQILSFDLDPTLFNSGSNSLRIEALGDHVPTGDYDLIDINKIEINYPAQFVAENDQLLLSDSVADQQINVSGFSSNQLKVYDLSNPLEAFSYDNIVYNEIASGNWLASFDAYQGLEGLSGRKIYILEENSFSSPEQYRLSSGDATGLDQIQGAELIIVGEEHLLNVTDTYVNHRSIQGVRSVLVTHQDLYNEFSNGRRSVHALRDFILMALNQWTIRPKYLLILGDATYDPNNHNALSQHTDVPVPILKGQHLDFGSDNWYATLDDKIIPELAVGRIPSSDSGTVRDFLDKVIAYENGQRTPDAKQVRESAFITGLDDKNENFDSNAEDLANTLIQANGDYSFKVVHRNANDNDAATKQKIKDSFNEGPIVMTYLGHGAENIWGGNDLFNTTDARELTNQSLPIVVALNCLNAHYYDPDSSKISMGEELILNPNGGAIAFWGSTTMTSPISQVNLATSLLDEVGQTSLTAETEQRLGDIVLRAKSLQPHQDYLKDTLFSYTLIGDPSLKLPEKFFTIQSASVPAPSVEVIHPSEPSPAPSSPSGQDDISSTTPTPPAASSSGKKGGGGCVAFGANERSQVHQLQLLEYPIIVFLVWLFLVGVRRFSSVATRFW